MKKVKDSISMQQKSDLSRGIALRNAAEARRLEDRIKDFESNLHQSLVDLDAEIMGLRLSPMLRRKVPPGKISPISHNLDPRSPADFQPIGSEKSHLPSGLSPESHEVITDLHTKTVIPSITVHDGNKDDYHPGFLPKISAPAAVIGNESGIRPPERDTRPKSGPMSNTKRSGSKENISTSPTLGVPNYTFQRSRSFGGKESARSRPRSPRRIKDLEDMLRPQQEPQPQRPSVNPKQELEDRIKKFLNKPNPHTQIPVHEPHPPTTGNPSETPGIVLNTNSTDDPQATSQDSLPSKEESSSTGASSLPAVNDGLKTDEASLSNGNSKGQALDRLEKEESAKEIELERKEKQDDKTNGKVEGQDVQLERQDTTKMKERRVGTVDQPETTNEIDQATDETEDIPSATGIPALDNLLLARAIADAERGEGANKGNDFDEVVKRRLESLLKDPPTPEEMKKIRYLRIPEDKIPDILKSVFGNEDGSITSVSHGNMALKTDTADTENASSEDKQ